MHEGSHADYYRASLRYLGCTELTTLSKEERKGQAFNLSLAALLGKDIFNFGELLAHSILDDLKGTDKVCTKRLNAFFLLIKKHNVSQIRLIRI